MSNRGRSDADTVCAFGRARGVQNVLPLSVVNFLLNLFLCASPVWAAVDFDATDDIIDCGSATALDDIWGGGGTIALWASLDTFDATLRRFAQKCAVSCVNGWQWWRNLDVTLNEITLQVGFSDFTAMTASWDDDISDTAYHHFALVYDSDAAANRPVLYIDGAVATLDDDSSNNAGKTYNSDGAAAFQIANRPSPFARPCDCKQADFAAWKGVSLSAAEVAVLASSRVKRLPLQIQPANLVLYLELESCAEGATCTANFRDYSDDNNTCAPANSPTGYSTSPLSYP